MSELRTTEDGLAMEWGEDGLFYRFTIDETSNDLLLSVIVGVSVTGESVVARVRSVPWLRNLPLAANGKSLLFNVAIRFADATESAPTEFRERFTEEEWALFMAGLCCWVTEYGNGHGIVWCQDPRGDGRLYCTEHHRDLRDLYGAAESYRCRVPASWSGG